MKISCHQEQYSYLVDLSSDNYLLLKKINKMKGFTV